MISETSENGVFYKLKQHGWNMVFVTTGCPKNNGFFSRRGAIASTIKYGDPGHSTNNCPLVSVWKKNIRQKHVAAL